MHGGRIARHIVVYAVEKCCYECFFALSVGLGHHFVHYIFYYSHQIERVGHGFYQFVANIEIFVREPRGVRRIFKRKKDVTLVVLEPITCMNNSEDIKQKVENLKQETYEKMNEILLKKKMGGNKDEDIDEGQICTTSDAGFGNE